MTTDKNGLWIFSIKSSRRGRSRNTSTHSFLPTEGRGEFPKPYSRRQGGIATRERTRGVLPFLGDEEEQVARRCRQSGPADSWRRKKRSNRSCPVPTIFDPKWFPCFTEARSAKRHPLTLDEGAEGAPKDPLYYRQTSWVRDRRSRRISVAGRYANEYHHRIPVGARPYIARESVRGFKTRVSKIFFDGAFRDQRLGKHNGAMMLLL